MVDRTMTPPKLLTVATDNNELELIRTIKGKENIYEYKFTKSETKKGMLMTLSESQLESELKKKIFI